MRQPLPYSPESTLFQLRTFRVALAGCSTRRWSLPALASRPLTVGWTGTLTWNVAAVPVPRLTVSLTVSLRCAKSSLRCQLRTAAFAHEAWDRVAVAEKSTLLPGVTFLDEGHAARWPMTRPT